MGTSVYVQDNGGTACSTVAAFCSGRSIGAGTMASFQMAEGGSATLSLVPYTMGVSEGPVVVAAMFGAVPAGVNQLDAQTIAVNFRLGVPSSGSPQLNEIHMCVLTSACALKATAGSVTGLTTALTSAALYTQNLVVGAPVAVDPGDVIVFLLVCTNTTSMATVSQNFTFNPATSISVVYSLAAAAPTRKRKSKYKMSTLGLLRRARAG